MEFTAMKHRCDNCERKKLTLLGVNWRGKPRLICRRCYAAFEAGAVEVSLRGFFTRGIPRRVERGAK